MALRRPLPQVRFLNDDAAKLWHAGDTADDLGPESPSTPSVRLLRVHDTGEVLAIDRPFDRNLIERIDVEPAP
jgi:hypothetical protein